MAFLGFHSKLPKADSGSCTPEVPNSSANARQKRATEYPECGENLCPDALCGRLIGTVRATE